MSVHVITAVYSSDCILGPLGIWNPLGPLGHLGPTAPGDQAVAYSFFYTTKSSKYQISNPTSRTDHILTTSTDCCLNARMKWPQYTLKDPYARRRGLYGSPQSTTMSIN